METVFNRRLARRMLCWLMLLPGGAAQAAVSEPYNVLVTSYPGITSSLIRWSSDAPAVTSFKVERRLPNGLWSQVALVGDATRSVADSGLAANTLYEYRVLAIRPGGPGGGYASTTYAFAAPPSTTTTYGYDAAVIPRKFDAQPMSPTDIYLSWEDVSTDETGFLIERRLAGGSWGTATTAPAGTLRYRDTGLAPGSSYEYRISALRPVGSAVTSAVVKASTPAVGEDKIFFVDGVRGDDNWPGSEGQPWRTIQHAADMLMPGQTVLVRWTATPYTRSNYYAIVVIQQQGDSNNYTTFKAYPGERPKLRSTYGVNYHGFEVKGGQYVVIDGFEVEGHLKDITSAVADQENASAQAGGSIGPITDSNGISVDNGAHHVIVRNNAVHDHPGGGINSIQSDYVTVEYNRVYNTSWYSPYGTSGISYLQSANADTNTSTYRQVIRGNIVSGAQNLYPCKCYQFRQQTDGNGIIMDTFNSSGYTGKTLVSNNIVFNNGGRGIHVLKSSNVDVFFNTAVRNGQIAITGEGEVTVDQSNGVRAWNNILVSRSDRPSNLVRSATAVDFNYNIVFGGNGFTGTGASGNRLNTDPRFAQGQDVDAFRLRGDSPALNSAGGGGEGVATLDVYRALRTRSGATDVGAAESF
jgi:parallel beta-helix repeat protein